MIIVATLHKLSLFVDRDALLCTLPGRRPGIAEGDELTRLGRVHLYFFLLFTKYSFLGYYRLLLLEVTMPKTEATN